MYQSGSDQILLYNGLPHEKKKDNIWMKNCLRGILNVQMDFKKMTFLEAETESSAPPDEMDELIDLLEHEEVREKKEVKSKTKASIITDESRESHLKKSFELVQYVFAMGGDNASVPVKAVVELQDELGTLPFGCASHAYSRSFQHVCEINIIDDQVFKKANTVVDLFLTRSQVREMLRAVCSKSLFRLIPTRFISGVIVCKRLLELRTYLETVVDGIEFNKYRQAGTTEAKVRKQCTEAKGIIQDDKFWHWLEFFISMSTGFVVAVRCMDGAKAGSVCLVYKLWSMLSDTAAQAFKDEVKRAESAKRECLATVPLFKDIAKVICKDWKKFQFPVYSAGYVLTPHFRSDIADLLRMEPEVGRGLLKDTVDCCVSIYRRFDFQGVRRSTVLSENCDEMRMIREKIGAEVEDYAKMKGRFAKAVMFSIGELRRSPSDWWDFVAPPEFFLRSAAVKITSLSPNTTPVERVHKVHKMQRTKPRNRLGYSRALGLNFISCEEALQNGSSSTETDWKHLLNYKSRFEDLSDSDRTFLEQLEKDASEAKANALQVEAEEQLVSTEVITPSTVSRAELEQDWESSSVDDLSEDETEPTDPGSGNGIVPEAEEGISHDNGAVAEPESAMTRLVSSRGRVIRRKLFQDFVLE